MPPTVVLASSSTPLSPSPALHLLPFSLGPNSNHYTSSDVDIPVYFQPRPSTSGPAGTITASFRGRQIVGQEVRVPRGYKGVIIAADKAGVESYSSRHGQRSGHDAEDWDDTGAGPSKPKWPLTPAASTASLAASTEVDGEEGLELRRSPKKRSFGNLKQRVKGAGQVALARPKRVMAKVGMRRFRLDSDDEDEPIQQEHAGAVDPAEDSNTSQDAPPAQETEETSPLETPRKRQRLNPSTPVRQSPRRARPETPSIYKGPQSASKRTALPEIKLQQATPLKEPLPPPPPFMRRKRNRADYVIPGEVVDEDLVKRVEIAAAGSVTVIPVDDEEVVSPSGPTKDSVRDEEGDSPVGDAQLKREESTVIPSPATENDPPPFPVDFKPIKDETLPTWEEATNKIISSEVDVPALSLDIDGPIRILRPISTFDSITLWTPDAPLAGYKPPSSHQGESQLETRATPSETEAGAQASGDGGIDEGTKVRPGWWAPGGSGEGGDEVVRAMGEWLGLVEMLNEPVYLDKFKNELNEDEDDEDETS